VIEIACESIYKPVVDAPTEGEVVRASPIHEALDEPAESYPDILSANDIQRILGIGQRQVYELLKQPPFPVKRIGARGVIRIPKQSFLDWLNSGN